MRVLPCGDAALLVEVDSLDDAVGLHAALATSPPAGVVETIPAARTVLVRFDDAQIDSTAVRSAVLAATPLPREARAGELIELPVRYDGPDLSDVSALTGLDLDEIVRLHTDAKYEVAFCGFAPGFGYLTGLDPRLQVERRDVPRTTVPAGAVGLAGEFTGVYPRPSPGGWQLIGHTRTPLWDVDRDPPALLRPGVRVHFVSSGT